MIFSRWRAKSRAIILSVPTFTTSAPRPLWRIRVQTFGTYIYYLSHAATVADSGSDSSDQHSLRRHRGHSSGSGFRFFGPIFTTLAPRPQRRIRVQILRNNIHYPGPSAADPGSDSMEQHSLHRSRGHSCGSWFRFFRPTFTNSAPRP